MGKKHSLIGANRMVDRTGHDVVQYLLIVGAAIRSPLRYVP